MASPRHCERSEAIQSDIEKLDCFVAQPVPGRREVPIRVLLAMMN
jgi:hypothetical protein